jgi:hypothetical protein
MLGLKFEIRVTPLAYTNTASPLPPPPSPLTFGSTSDTPDAPPCNPPSPATRLVDQERAIRHVYTGHQNRYNVKRAQRSDDGRFVLCGSDDGR